MGGIYGGYLQGQALQQQLQQGALAIREHQAQLDQQKQRLAAAAAAFQGLAGDQQAAPVPGAPAQGAPQAAPPQNPVQPMPPGQPSLPNRPQAPGGAQPGAMPAPSAPQAPAPQMPAPGAPQGVQGPFQILGEMARRLAQANPGADPTVLADALQQQVALMRGVQPEIKDQLNAVINQQKIDLQIQKLQQTGEYQQMLLELRGQGLDQRMAELTLRERVATLADQLRGDTAARKEAEDMVKPGGAQLSGIIDINQQIKRLFGTRTEEQLKPEERQQLQALQAKRTQLVAEARQQGLDDAAIKAGIKGPTAAQIRDQEKADQVGDTLNLGQDIMQRIGRLSTPVGVGGAVRRGVETLGGLIGIGGQEARELKSDITTFATEYQRLMSNRGYLTASDRSDLNTIIGAMQPGSNKQLAIDQVQAVMNRLVGKYRSALDRQQGRAPKAGGSDEPAPAAPQYQTPDDVKAAVQSGRLDRQAATQILKDQFGFSD